MKPPERSTVRRAGTASFSEWIVLNGYCIASWVKWRCYESKMPQPKSGFPPALLTPGNLVKKFLLPIQLLALEWLPSGSGHYTQTRRSVGLERTRTSTVLDQTARQLGYVA